LHRNVSLVYKKNIRLRKQRVFVTKVIVIVDSGMLQVYKILYNLATGYVIKILCYTI